MKTARKAGLKPKESSRKQKYILPTPPLQRRTLTLEGGQPQKERPSSLVFDDELAGKRIAMYSAQSIVGLGWKMKMGMERPTDENFILYTPCWDVFMVA